VSYEKGKVALFAALGLVLAVSIITGVTWLLPGEPAAEPEPESMLYASAVELTMVNHPVASSPLSNLDLTFEARAYTVPTNSNFLNEVTEGGPHRRHFLREVSGDKVARWLGAHVSFSHNITIYNATGAVIFEKNFTWTKGVDRSITVYGNTSEIEPGTPIRIVICSSLTLTLPRGRGTIQWTRTKEVNVVWRGVPNFVQRRAPGMPWMYKLWFDDNVLDEGRQTEWWDASVYEEGDDLNASFWSVYEDINYTSDWNLYHRLEYYAKASETLGKGAGDCEDKAILFASTAYLNFSGDPKVIFGRAQNRGHAWVEMDETVYDPYHGVIMPTDEYYNQYNASCYMWFNATHHWHDWPEA